MNDLNNFNVNNNSTPNVQPNLSSSNNNQYNDQTNQQFTTVPNNNEQSTPATSNVNQNSNVDNFSNAEPITNTPDSSTVNNPPIDANTNDTKPSNIKGILIIVLIIISICLVAGGGYLVYKNFIAKESNNNGNELEKLTLNTSNIKVEVGKISPLEVTNLADGETITWTSNDVNIATIDSSGMATGVAVGTTTIKAETSKKRTAVVNVVVEKGIENSVAVTSIKLTSSKTKIKVGESLTLSATILPKNVSDKTIYWSSSNNAIATVDNTGKLKALKKGTVTITGKTSNNKTSNITITIEEYIPVISLKINETKKDFNINSSQQYTLAISPSNATDKTVTWSSSDTNVATVSTGGLVTIKNAGTATITAKSANQKTSAIALNVTIPNSCFTMSGTKITGYKRTDNTCKTNVMNIPSSLRATEIGDSVFYSMQLISITIPNSIKTIGDRTFHSNLITSATIPNSVTSIGINPFSSNPTLVSITVNSTNPNYKSINNAIYTKDGKKLITGTKGMANKIESTVTTIGDSTFYNMQITSVTIPNSVTTIDDYAFYINRLTNAIIPNGVTKIGNSAFQHNQLTTVNIPDDVMSIGEMAFSSNQYLTSVTIPNSVTTIGVNPFSLTPKLTSITIGSSNPNYKSVNNAIYTKDGKKLITGTKGMANNIEPTVTTIDEYAFAHNQLTSVTIPNSVKTINRNAFYGNELTSVTIPNSVTSIGLLAFSNNNILQGNATIDNASGAVTIGSDAFRNNGAGGTTAITPVYLR